MLYYDDVVLASCVCCPKVRERESSPIFAPFFSLYIPNINISIIHNSSVIPIPLLFIR